MSSSKRALRLVLTPIAALASVGVLAVTPLTPQNTASAAAPDIPLADFELYSDDNLVANPGFEQASDGWPDQWTPWSAQSSSNVSSSTERAHSGTRSVRIEDQNSQLGFGARGEKTPIIAEKRYTASAYAYNESGSLTLYIEFWNAAGQRISTTSQTASGPGEWSKVTVHADAPATATDATVLLYSVTTNTGVSFVDDVHLVPTAAATDITNPGFETADGSWPVGWTPWSSQSSSAVESTTERAKTGARSVRITDDDSTIGVGLRSQKVPADPGQRYSASAQVYVESGAIDLYIEFWNASGQRISTATRSASERGTWLEARTGAYAPANAAHATVLLYANSTNVGDAFVDDVALSAADPLDGSTLLPDSPPIDEVTVTDRFASQGNYSLHLHGSEFNTKQGRVWPRVHLPPGSVLPTVNWAQRQYLRVGAVNASMRPARMHVMAWHRNGKRHDISQLANPFEYKVFQIRTADIAAAGLDLSQVGIWVFIERSLHPTDMFVDDVRLTDSAVNLPAEQAAVAPALVESMNLPGILDERWDALDAAQAKIMPGSAEPETTLRAAAGSLEDELEAFADQAGCQRSGTDLSCADPSPLRNDPGAARSVLLGVDELKWDIGRLSGKIDARAASPSSPVGFGFADSMSRTYPRDLPCDYTRSTELDLVRGEHESIQLVAVPYGEGLDNAQVQTSVISGPSGGLTADAHPVASLNLVPPVYQPPAWPTEFRPSIYQGWTPDPIQTDRDAVDVGAGDLQAYWVSLETTAVAAPGDYTVELSFAATGIAAQTSTITVTVHDAQVGNEPELRTAIGHAPHAYAGAYGVTDPEEIAQLIEEEYEFLGEYWLQGDNIYRHVEGSPPSVERLQRIDQQYGGLRHSTSGTSSPSCTTSTIPARGTHRRTRCST